MFAQHLQIGAGQDPAFDLMETTAERPGPQVTPPAQRWWCKRQGGGRQQDFEKLPSCLHNRFSTLMRADGSLTVT
jgi:hypothetical protein